MKKHLVQLSNGKTVCLEEHDNALHIAAMHNGYVDGYICEINANGVLTYPNSCAAPEYLTDGLKKETEAEGKRTAIADGMLKYTLDGQNWTPAPNGMNVMLENASIPNEERGDLVFYFTDEGVITDVWQENDGETQNLGTASQTYDDVLDGLVADNE